MPCLSFKRLFALAALLVLAACGNHASSLDAIRQDAELGDAALNAGTPELALRLADDTLSRDPKNADALVRRGTALTTLGRLNEARDNLIRAVALKPHDTRALLALGRVQLPVDPAAAEVTFETILQQDDKNAAALNNLGIARDLRGNYAEAEAAFRAALEAAPAMTAAQVNLALCLAIRGKENEAIGLMRPLADQPGATRKVKQNYAAVLAMAGQRDQAERILADNMAASEVAPALDALASVRIAEGGATR